MKFVAGLTCHLCGATYPAQALWVCTECLGPLEVTYDYAAIRKVISRAADRVAAAVALALSRAAAGRIAEDRFQLRLHAAREGRCVSRASSASSELYIKDDSVNHPTFSYKDRVVSVAATRGGGARLPGVRLRVDRQSRRQRGRARRAARPAVLRLHSERSRAEQDPWRRHLRPARSSPSRATTTT